MANEQKFRDKFQSEVSSSSDDDVLRELGIQRELKREFSTFSTISFAMGVSGCAATIASTVNTPLLLGGPATTIWAWLLGAVGCLALAASVSELVSAYPTAGGIYTTTSFVIPSKYRSSVSFISAWMTIIGQITSTTSINFALAQMIFAAVTIGSGGAFTASTGQLLGLYVGITSTFGIVCILPTTFLHRISSVCFLANMVAIFSVILGIFIGGRGKLAPSKFVWTTISDQTGWGNRGFVLLIGLLSVQWVMVYISEEVVNAATAAPIAIFIGAVTTSFLGFFVNVALCYGIRDFSALPGPTGLVFAQIVWDNLGRAGGLVVWILIIVVQTLVGITCQMSAIRDKKVPAKIWKVTQTPVNSAIMVIIVSAILGLLSLASTIAIPIIGKLYIYWNKDSDVKFRPGPFYMGKLGYVVNMYAVVCILIMPQVLPVTASTMNYSGPIIGGVFGVSWVWYKLYWYKYYHGPGMRLGRAMLDDQEGSIEKTEKTN
ncbi:amino acid/polyamine transporter I [Hysterangium stoloniferum]|nr:amino acid/polyamine transporter I [Hysterangium stoloniferum]